SPPTDACLTERASPAFQFQNPNPIPRQLPTKQRLSILGLKFSRRVVHQLASRSQWPGQAPRNHQVRRILRMVSRTAAGKATAAQRPALTTRQNFIEKTPKGRLSILRKMDKRSEEHTSELQSHLNIVCRLLLEKKKTEDCSCLVYKLDAI